MADVGRWKVGSPQTASCCGCFLTQILREGAAGAMECSRAGWRGGLWYVAGGRCAGRGLSQDVHGCCCGSPQIPAWLPRAPLVNERSLAVCLWASFSPLGSQFPLLQKGGSDLLSPAPPSPQSLLGTAGACSHGLTRHKDPEARAGPAGGGGRAGSLALSPSHGSGAPGPSPGPGGPPCDSGFLEEARESNEDSPPPHPEFPQRPPVCPVTAPPLPTVGSTCCLLCACPQRAPLPATSAGTLRASSVGAGTGPSSSLAWTRPCQAKHFLPFHLPMGSAAGPSPGLHFSLAGCPAAHLLGIAMRSSGGARGCPGLPMVTSQSPPHSPREPRAVAPALPGLSG